MGVSAIMKMLQRDILIWRKSWDVQALPDTLHRFVQKYGPMKIRPMNILFVADPLASFKISKDTTFSMMRELQRRGHGIAVTEPKSMAWRSGQPVTATVRHIRLTGHADLWFEMVREVVEPVHGFDAVLMRKVPPFDSEFFYSTHLLEHAER